MAAIRTFNSLCSWILGFTLCSTAPAGAAEGSQAGDAAQHFDRGYLLAQQGRLEAAISEFKRAYALSPHPSVLYNLGQAYAASGRAVQAVQTLREYLQQADVKHEAERRAQALATIDYQTQRIGTLELHVEPTGAELMLDGESLGSAPLKAPLPLSAGSHGLTVTHAGYMPRTVRVEIAGKANTAVRVTLEPSAGPTRLTVTCSVPDITVSGRGVASARLERGGELLVLTPTPELRFERPGFLPVVRAIPADTTDAIDCGLAALDPHAALVPVAIDAPRAIAIRVDGRPFRRGKLPLGRHLVALSGTGIEYTERWIEIGQAPRTFLVDAREPGATMAAERNSRRKLQLTLAVVTAATGAVSLGAAGAIYAFNQSAYSEWRDDGRLLASRMTTAPDQVSAGDWNRLLERENALRNRDAAALGLTVFGGIMLTSGAVLWLSAPRPATSAVTLRVGKVSWVGYSGDF
jgi:tetratricopeptide (TPR) repeat protein